jgi:uncharacterized alkaline shock family protein YloU
MSEELYADGLGIAPGVMETIVALAAKEVDGVASVGSSTLSGFRSRLSAKPANQGIDVTMDEDQRINVAIHIDVLYGKVIPVVAEAVRAAVADAVATQVGFDLAAVDVFVDGLVFE